MKKHEERKERRKSRAKNSKFSIDPIAERKKTVDKNPFRKKPLPTITSPMRASIREENIEAKKQLAEENKDTVGPMKRDKKSKIGAFSRKTNAVMKASKY